MLLFKLPPPPDKGVISKRYLDTRQAPDLSTFNEGQAKVADRLMLFLGLRDLHPDEQPLTNDEMIVLHGPGGTGKTYLITKLLEAYIHKFPNRKVALSAPTNKAVKVLYRMADWQHTAVDYTTVHSALCLTERITPNGRIEFTRDFRREPTVGDYSLFIVDESSMLPDELFNDLAGYAKEGVKFIFMGDDLQIPPVRGKGDSIPFAEKSVSLYSWEVLRLTQVVRQSVGNPIINLCVKVRERISSPISYTQKENALFEGDKGVYFLTAVTRDETIKYRRLLLHLFGSENFKRDGDFARVLAWQNKTVDATNKVIRRLVYGVDANEIEVGERLVTNEPILEDNRVKINNSEDLEVLDYTRKIELVNDGDYEIEYFLTTVRHYRLDNSPAETVIRILSERGRKVYEEILQHLADVAKAADKNFAARYWREYYNFKRLFADVSYAYCQTVHKAQGSTYDNVVVIETCIDQVRVTKERNRIRYTAFSRPRHRLFVLK